MSNKLKGTIFVLICVALWALIPVVAKLGQASLDNHQFLFWSSLVSLIVLSVTAIVKGDMAELRNYSVKEWMEENIKMFITNHQYYTDYAKANWQGKKDKNLTTLGKELKKKNKLLKKNS